MHRVEFQLMAVSEELMRNAGDAPALSESCVVDSRETQARTFWTQAAAAAAAAARWVYRAWLDDRNEWADVEMNRWTRSHSGGSKNCQTKGTDSPELQTPVTTPLQMHAYILRRRISHRTTIVTLYRVSKHIFR